MTHRNQFHSIYSSFKKRFHKEKGHFTSKEKGTFCVIFKVGGGPCLRPDCCGTIRKLYFMLHFDKFLKMT